MRCRCTLRVMRMLGRMSTSALPTTTSYVATYIVESLKNRNEPTRKMIPIRMSLAIDSVS